MTEKSKIKTEELINYDLEFMNAGYNFVAGVDEAGRGPLAGPVVVASVIMPMDFIIYGINDSKKVTEKRREELFDIILDNAIAYSIVFKDNNVIDDVNILNATKLAMKECVCNLCPEPNLILIDAVNLEGINCEQKSIIKGDATSYAIAAASILAKVSRDRYMREISSNYPEYNFSKHKGYGTKEHIDAIKKYGLCEIHRKSFTKNFIKGN